MKTLTFTIDIPTTTIKERMLVELEEQKAQEDKESREFNTHITKLWDLAREVQKALNDGVGEEIWKLPKNANLSHKNTSFGKHCKKNIVTLEIYFDSRKRNTTTHEYSLCLFFEYGETEEWHRKLTTDSEVRMCFADDSKSGTYRDERVFIDVTDLNKVHTFAEDGYKKYFKNAQK